jgi:hypothetical protein
MKALLDHLAATGDRPADFARRIGLEPEILQRALEGGAMLDRSVLLRIIDLSGGALTLADLDGEAGVAEVADFRARFAAKDEIDIEALTSALAEALLPLFGGMRRKGDEFLPRLAAEATAGAYDALSTITTRRGADRLAQALRPVVEEILAELSAPSSLKNRVEEAVGQATVRYQTLRQARL